MILSALLGALCVAHAPAGPVKRSLPRAVKVYTLNGCDACASLKSHLRHSGVELAITHISERKYDLYPTVIYSDGRSDHGNRVWAGRCSLPQSLPVYETD